MIEIISRDEKLTRKYGDAEIDVRRLGISGAAFVANQIALGKSETEAILEWSVTGWRGVRAEGGKEDLPLLPEYVQALPAEIILDVVLVAKSSRASIWRKAEVTEAAPETK